MALPTLAWTAEKFIALTGEVLAEVKRQDIAAVDLELLRLKRTVLREKLDEARADITAETEQKKGQAVQDSINKGLGNTTIVAGRIRAIEQDAALELERASREYSRTLEELALIEQKVVARMRPAWKKLLDMIGLHCK